MFRSFTLVTVHVFLEPWFPLYRPNSDPILMLLIGSPVVFRVAAPPTARLAAESSLCVLSTAVSFSLSGLNS